MRPFTKTLSVYPHLQAPVLDGGCTEEDDGTLEFRQDQGPSAGERGALEDEVELWCSAWLRRHGHLEDGAEGRPDDPWWPPAAREPSGIVSGEPKRLRGRLKINASVRVGADDRDGRVQFVHYAARSPFAEVQLEPFDEEQMRFTLCRPTPTTQRELLLHPLS